MSSISGDWAALASQHERLLAAADVHDRQAAARPATHDQARWAELASQRERLVEADDPLCGLASSPRRTPRLRLAAPAA